MNRRGRDRGASYLSASYGVCALLDRPLAELAAQNGWAGVVIYSCVRHSADLAGIAIGIKALAVHPLKSFKHGVGQQGGPLRFAGVHFLLGHYLDADEDGWVVVEKALETAI